MKLDENLLSQRLAEEALTDRPVLLSSRELQLVSGGGTAESSPELPAANSVPAPLQPPPPPTWPTW